MEQVSAQVLGLSEFDAKIFEKKIKEIQVPDNGELIYVFHNGATVTATWENPSRRESWNEENRQRAREYALKGAAKRRAASCQK